jgi:hypothetical protein
MAQWYKSTLTKSNWPRATRYQTLFRWIDQGPYPSICVSGPLGWPTPYSPGNLMQIFPVALYRMLRKAHNQIAHQIPGISGNELLTCTGIKLLFVSVLIPLSHAIRIAQIFLIYALSV